jgi:enoyl-CoA hydratase/carnithine racemase
MANITQQLADHQDARLAVLEGVPGSFCAGLDIERLGGPDPDLGAADVETFTQVLDLLRRGPQLVVALVDGAALGGGVGLVAAADLVIASPRATFALPEMFLGLVPAAVFPHVVRRIGVPRARLMAFGAPPLDAHEAKAAGLVDVVSDNPQSTLARYTARLLRSDARAVGAFKALIAKHFDEPRGYRAEAMALFAELLASEITRRRLALYAEGHAPWEAQ